MTRIPIYLAETEVGPGLPTQRNYWHYKRAESDQPIGWIVLPEGMTADYVQGYIVFERPGKGDPLVDFLPPIMAVQAAIVGEHGLCWEAAGQSATTKEQAP